MLIFNIIFPIFAIAGLGYTFATLGLFKQHHVQGLSQYVFYLAIPALLIQSLSQMALPQQINWRFLGSYYGVVLVIYLTGFGLKRYVFGGSRRAGAIFGMGSSYSNLVLMGIPVVSAGFGDEGLVALFLIISVHSVTQFTITTVLAESQDADGKSLLGFLRLSAEKLLKNPLIIALFIGLLLNWFNIQIPEVILNTIGLLRRSALPAALFMLGASLTAYKISGELKQSAVMVGLKLAIQPLLVYLLVVQLFQLPHLWSAVAVVAAALPCGVNAAVFANKYDAAVAAVGSSVLLSTLLSMGTISFLLTLLV